MPTPSQRPRGLPFHGLSKQLIAIGGLVVGAPVLLHLFHLIEPETTAVSAGLLFLLVLGAFSVFALFDGAGRRLRGALAALALLGALASAGVGLVSAIYPGEPVARATLGLGVPVELGSLAAGDYRVVLHTDALRDRSRGPVPRLLLEVAGARLAGAFEARAAVVRPKLPGAGPGLEAPEWTSLRMSHSGGPARATLLQRDEALDGPMGLRLYASAQRPLTHWLAAALAGLLALVAAAFDNHLRRQFIVTPVVLGVAFAILAAHWAWIGDPMRPLLGAGAVVLIPAWLVGKLASYASRALPWRGE